jgi:hypothetical protein
LRSGRQQIGRLRLVIVVLLALAALISALATLTERLHLQLGLFLTFTLTVLAVLAPSAESWLKQALAVLDKQDQSEEERAKAFADRARRDVLEQVRRAWVQPELRGSLYEQARIELGLTERPAAVDNPLRAVLRRPDEPDHLLERGQPIVQAYRQLGRQLLILGEPGAGKTALLMELAEQLLDEAVQEADQPMPVIFHLSTWAAERRPLADWLVDEFSKRYGVPRRLGTMWVDADQITPLLDGLDEVATEHRNSCAAAINTFHDEHGLSPLVVCSRILEYETLQAKLRLRGAVVIQPLTRIEIEHYLQQAGPPLAGVRGTLGNDAQLWELLTTPLFLSIVALTYQDRSPGPVPAGNLEQGRHRVLTDYVNAMMTRPRALMTRQQYSQAQSRGWLSWLAQSMLAHDQTVFYLDWLQPTWLPTRAQQRLVTLGVAVSIALVIVPVFGLVFGFGVGLVIVLINAPVDGLAKAVEAGSQAGVIAGLIFGPVSGLLGGINAYGHSITPVRQSHWSLATMRRNLRKTVAVGLAFGSGFALVTGLLFGLLNGLATGLVAALEYGFPVALSITLISVLGGGLEAQRHIAPGGPGQGMKTSRRSAIVSGLGGALAAGVAIALTFVPIATLAALRNGFPAPTALRYGLIDGLLGGLFIGLLFGLIFGLRRGGASFVRHLGLRWLLSHYQLAPWDYIAFMEYAATLILVRQLGGGYEFVHRLLLDYFASLQISQPPARRSVSDGRTKCKCKRVV